MSIGRSASEHLQVEQGGSQGREPRPCAALLQEAKPQETSRSLPWVPLGLEAESTRREKEPGAAAWKGRGLSPEPRWHVTGKAAACCSPREHKTAVITLKSGVTPPRHPDLVEAGTDALWRSPGTRTRGLHTTAATSGPARSGTVLLAHLACRCLCGCVPAHGLTVSSAHVHEEIGQTRE